VGGEGEWGHAEGREREEAMQIEKNEETYMDNNGKSHRRRGFSLEPRRNPSIDGEPKVGPMNRKHRDEALDKTNAAVLSNFANDAQIESNCSPELETPRTSASNSRNYGLNLGKWFLDLERARREGSIISILLGFEDILFFAIILFLKLK
jgi:hypothetical protein